MIFTTDMLIADVKETWITVPTVLLYRNPYNSLTVQLSVYNVLPFDTLLVALLILKYHSSEQCFFCILKTIYVRK